MLKINRDHRARLVSSNRESFAYTNSNTILLLYVGDIRVPPRVPANNSTVNLPGVILLFKIRDASGERKYLIKASNLTELTLTLNKSSKNVFLKCSFICFI